MFENRVLVSGKNYFCEYFCSGLGDGFRHCVEKYNTLYYIDRSTRINEFYILV